jgi:hypothetical protein
VVRRLTRNKEDFTFQFALSLIQNINITHTVVPKQAIIMCK